MCCSLANASGIWDRRGAGTLGRCCAAAHDLVQRPDPRSIRNQPREVAMHEFIFKFAKGQELFHPGAFWDLAVESVESARQAGT